MTRPAWASALVAWFARDQRPMPWRDAPTPYRVWVSEIMLQQTRVDTVIPYFERFTARFPDVAALAAAPLDDVLRLWEGLGYYARARNLLHAARALAADRGGRFPTTAAAWRVLPGVGDYTAAAIASIAFGEAVPAIDGNVLRVASRYWGLAADIRTPAAREAIRARLLPAIRRVNPSWFNQGLMELGARICLPRRPLCDPCPLRRGCVARRAGRQAALPVRSRQAPGPHYPVAIGIVRHHGRVLLGRRPEQAMLGGLWEFPGGKLQRGERAAAACAREVFEETGLRVRVGTRLATIRHTYSHFSVTLEAFLCTVPPGRAAVAPKARQPFKWVALGTLADYPMPRANRKLVALLLQAQEGAETGNGSGRCRNGCG